MQQLVLHDLEDAHVAVSLSALVSCDWGELNTTKLGNMLKKCASNGQNKPINSGLAYRLLMCSVQSTNLMMT